MQKSKGEDKFQIENYKIQNKLKSGICIASGNKILYNNIAGANYSLADIVLGEYTTKCLVVVSRQDIIEDQGMDNKITGSWMKKHWFQGLINQKKPLQNDF